MNIQDFMRNKETHKWALGVLSLGLGLGMSFSILKAISPSAWTSISSLFSAQTIPPQKTASKPRSSFLSPALSQIPFPQSLNEAFKKGQSCFERRAWERARYYMQQAFDEGENEAAYYLALSLEALRKEEDRIPQLLEPLANEGRLDSQRELGFFYLDRDNEEAGIPWLQKAAQSGDTLAQCRLSLLEMEKKNYSDCEEELELIAKHAGGSMALQYQLGVARLKCDPDELDFLGAMKESAEMGYFPAQEHLGRIYFYPNPWVQRSWEDSKEWLEKAAVHGYPPAMYQLGLWHFSKDLDNTQAMQWIERAAIKGHTEAQFFMGRRAEQAPFPQKDSILSWYEKSQSNEALNRLGVLYAQGVFGLKKDYKKSKEWFEKAALQGHAAAQNNLGLLYFYHTQDCADSDEEALYWFQKAAAQGYRSALHNAMILLALMERETVVD